MEPDTSQPDLFTHRYLLGRPPTAATNPRGKHHRKPLPWCREKISRVELWAEDAHEYRKYLWQTQTQKSDSNTETGRVSRRPNKPHFLGLINAHVRRNRTVRYHCSCCYDLTHVEPLRRWRREWPALREEGRVLSGEGVRLPGEAVTLSEGDVNYFDEGQGQGQGQGQEESDRYEREPGFGLGDIQREVFTMRHGRRRGKRKALPRVWTMSPGGSLSGVADLRDYDLELGNGVSDMDGEGGEQEECEWEFVWELEVASGRGSNDGSVSSGEWLVLDADVGASDSEEEDWEVFG